jgi:hypothetical protein
MDVGGTHAHDCIRVTLGTCCERLSLNRGYGPHVRVNERIWRLHGRELGQVESRYKKAGALQLDHSRLPSFADTHNTQRALLKQGLKRRVQFVRAAELFFSDLAPVNALG